MYYTFLCTWKVNNISKLIISRFYVVYANPTPPSQNYTPLNPLFDESLYCPEIILVHNYDNQFYAHNKSRVISRTLEN